VKSAKKKREIGKYGRRNKRKNMKKIIIMVMVMGNRQ
jgi:hypothetical protein